jgi:hypothetical protein
LGVNESPKSDYVQLQLLGHIIFLDQSQNPSNVYSMTTTCLVSITAIPFCDIAQKQVHLQKGGNGKGLRKMKKDLRVT